MVNGFPGCGKTMLSPIISSFTKVEIMQYAPLIEQICELWSLGRIDDDVAESMIRMNADLLIYNCMMGRNANCRPSDLSSIFRHRPTLHLKRMLMKGDEVIPQVIKSEKPILQLTTHMLFPSIKLLFKAIVSACGLPLILVTPNETIFLFFTITHPTEGFFPVNPF